MTYTKVALLLGSIFTVGLGAVAIAQIAENGAGSAALFLLALASVAMVGMIALGTVVGGRGAPKEFPTATIEGRTEPDETEQAVAAGPVSEPTGHQEEAPG